MKQGEHNWEVTGVKELFLYTNIYPSSEIRKSEDMNCPYFLLVPSPVALGIILGAYGKAGNGNEMETENRNGKTTSCCCSPSKI